MARSKSAAKKSAAKKAGKTRKSRSAAKKASKTRKPRAVAKKKAAVTRKKRPAAKKAVVDSQGESARVCQSEDHRQHNDALVKIVAGHRGDRQPHRHCTKQSPRPGRASHLILRRRGRRTDIAAHRRTGGEAGAPEEATRGTLRTSIVTVHLCGGTPLHAE